ncbi:DUF4065 domain-containing protein [Streptococcus suis]|nr:DUF4065 domain-containing protein [Streptococcus suis]
MKLTKVIINNFRSFGDSQVIGFNDQTVLIGNNSSGKTTVLQALSKLFSDKQNDKRFVNIGRHSNNSSFGKTQFGNTFEESDNYISKCFYNEQDDFFIRVGLPNPDINFEKYSQMMCKDISKFDKEELKKVTMKSRCYFGKKIYGSDRNPIGVLMIESRKSNLSVILGGKKKELKKKTEYEELSNLIDLNFQYILQSLHKYTNHYYYNGESIMNIDVKLRDILRYILKKYPYNFDLNKTRLTKLVYLIDWEMAKKYKRSCSGINWYFDNYGPYVHDVMKEATSDEQIKINEGFSNYGGARYTFQLVDPNFSEFSSLNLQELQIIDSVIDSTKDMSFNNFINYVYNTPPVAQTPQYQTLNLIKIASDEIDK